MIQDINEKFPKILGNATDPHIPLATAELGLNVGEKLLEKLRPGEARDRFADKKIYASEIGTKCMRKLWYKFRPEYAPEQLTASNHIKFSYGDILEELVLFIAKLTGHKVEHRQRRVQVPIRDGWSISGKIDATIDGELVDVKSCSSHSFQKIKAGLEDDAFGYKEQIATYALDHTLVPNNRAFILPVDKTLGHVDLVEFNVNKLADPLVLADSIVTHVMGYIPVRCYEPVPMKTGGYKLDTECSYCPFKFTCWPGLKVNVTSRGPVFVVRA